MYMIGSKLKKYVIVNNLVPHTLCAICNGGSTWMGKPLVLHMDHIDGNRYNSDLKNLRFLCPNCHTQQPTSNRRRPGAIRITLEAVQSVINECASKREILLRLGKSEASANYTALMNLFKKHGLTITKKKCYVYHPKVSRRKVTRPSKEELDEMLKTSSPEKIGKLLGVSGNAVRKWVKNYRSCGEIGLSHNFAKVKF